MRNHPLKFSSHEAGKRLAPLTACPKHHKQLLANPLSSSQFSRLLSLRLLLPLLPLWKASTSSRRRTRCPLLWTARPSPLLLTRLLLLPNEVERRLQLAKRCLSNEEERSPPSKTLPWCNEAARRSAPKSCLWSEAERRPPPRLNSSEAAKRSAPTICPLNEAERRLLPTTSLLHSCSEVVRSFLMPTMPRLSNEAERRPLSTSMRPCRRSEAARSPLPLMLMLPSLLNEAERS